MRIIHHRDGSYSLTELTADDVRKLASGLSADSIYNPRWPDFDDKSREWLAQSQIHSERLCRVLEEVARYDSDVLPRGRSLELTSLRAGAIDQNDVYGHACNVGVARPDGPVGAIR